SSRPGAIRSGSILQVRPAMAAPALAGRAARRFLYPVSSRAACLALAQRFSRRQQSRSRRASAPPWRLALALLPWLSLRPRELLRQLSAPKPPWRALSVERPRWRAAPAPAGPGALFRSPRRAPLPHQFWRAEASPDLRSSRPDTGRGRSSTHP